MYYLKHEQKSDISDKAWTANVLNGLKNDPSDELIGVILKLNVIQAKKIKAKVYVNDMIFYHI
jgi:hypothetical protein